MGLRSDALKSVAVAKKLTFAASGIYFDDRGMHFVVLASETEAGSATELQKIIGNGQIREANMPDNPDQRLERIGRLFLDASSLRVLLPKRWIHAHTLVPTAGLDNWFAPFMSGESKNR